MLHIRNDVSLIKRQLHFSEGNAMEFNPYLATSSAANPADANKGGPEAIEHPSHTRNIPWQTRPGVLTDFEDTLADTLMAMFREGVEDLPAIVAQLNAKGPRHPDGSWNEANYQSLMHELAQKQFAGRDA
jgi:hypothetical protein